MATLNTIVVVLVCESFLSANAIFDFFGGANWNPKNSEDLIRLEGYPFEKHEVPTEDGYILEMHRIPYGRQWKDSQRVPVILHHGNFLSSADWLLNTEKNNSFPYLLANHGYDVWLGNRRGNTYSTKYFDPKLSDPTKFWDFGFHESGQYDVPAMIDYVVNATGHRRLQFVGYSMGGADLLVGLSLRPEYNLKIRLGILLAPAVYAKNLAHGFARFIVPFAWASQKFMKNIGPVPILPPAVERILHAVLPVICSPKFDWFKICPRILGSSDGVQITRQSASEILRFTPASSSLKLYTHVLQLVASNRFCAYDYGLVRNLLRYNQTKPPEYQLNNVFAPTALMFSDADGVALPRDFVRLADNLGNLVRLFELPNKHRYGHVSFLYNKNAKELVYDPLLELMKLY